MRRPAIIFTLVLIAFLVPRLIGTNAYINIDGAGYWFERTDRFWNGMAAGDMLATIPAPHPGVTLTWLAGASFRIAHAVGALDKLPTNGDPFSQSAALPFAALPAVLSTTLLAGVALWRFKGETKSLGLAAIALLFLAVDPWFLSQSRQFHLDALAIAWSFMGLLLAPMERTGRWRWRLVFAGIAFALGILARFSSVLVPGITVLYLWWRWRDLPWRPRLSWLGAGAASALGTALLLWPVIVTNPWSLIGTLRTGAGWALREHVDLPYLDAIAPWDQWLQDPLTLLFRVSLVMLAVVVVFLIRRRWRDWSDLQRLLGLAALAIFSVIWAAPKSIDRYLLPAVVALDLLAGLALAHFWQRHERWHVRIGVFVLGFFFVSAAQIVRLMPFENIARNSLFHTLYPSVVGRSTTVQLGWGEGLKEIGFALDRLADQSNVLPPERLIVAAWYADALEPFTRAKVVSLSLAPNNDVDYIVLYQNQLGRNVYPSLARAILNENTQPAFSVSVDGYGLAWVYPVPTAIRRAAAPLQKYRSERGNLTTVELRDLLSRRGSNHWDIGGWR